jgi:hypothetical protein
MATSYANYYANNRVRPRGQRTFIPPASLLSANRIGDPMAGLTNLLGLNGLGVPGTPLSAQAAPAPTQQPMGQRRLPMYRTLPDGSRGKVVDFGMPRFGLPRMPGIPTPTFTRPTGQMMPSGRREIGDVMNRPLRYV